MKLPRIPRPADLLLAAPRWVEERFGLGPLLRELRETNVPRHLQSPLYYLGALALTALLVLGVTGILLALHYVPSVEHAWDSVQYIEHQVPLGGFTRSLHRWASSLLMVTMVLHMLRVFVIGSYKKPREGAWLVGVILFLLVVTAAFTGSLLPWNQRGFYGAGVGAEVVGFGGDIPLIGPLLQPLAEAGRSALLGGPEVGPWTLTRFYTLHVTVLPLLLGGLVGLHVYLVKVHDRRTIPPVLRRNRGPAPEDRKPLWPTHLVEIAAMMVVFAGFMALLAATVDPTRPFEPGVSPESAALLDRPADPYRTPPDILPEWYFVGLDQLLRVVPPWAAVALVGLFLLGLAATPFVDRGPDPHPSKRKPLVGVGLLVTAVWLGLTLAGATA